jgi:GT2 family glycosyltransferase
MTLSEQNPGVCIVVLNYNGWVDTLECLESILRINYDNYRIVVVDNDSRDGSLEKIKLWAEGRLSIWLPEESPHRDKLFPPVPKPVRILEYNREDAENAAHRSPEDVDRGSIALPGSVVLIKSDRNLGFAGGNNIGINYALKKRDFEYLWLLNNDTVVTAQALAKLVERMRRNPEAGMCGSTLLYYHKPDKVHALAGVKYNRWLGLSRQIGLFQDAHSPVDASEIEKQMSYISAASMLVSRELLEEVGPMCEDYFLYFEELDWTVRSENRFRMVYAPESIVFHKEGRSIGSSWVGADKSELSDYYGQLNRIRFTRRFYPEALPTVYLSFVIVIFNRLRRRQWRRVWMIIRILLFSLFGLQVKR